MCSAYSFQYVSLFIVWLLALLFITVEFEVEDEHYSFTLKVNKKITLSNSHLCPHWSTLQLINPPGERVGLLSMPGSGSTWARHVLQSATGLSTGSVYHDEQLVYNGYPGEKLDDGSVLAVKDYMEKGIKKEYSKVIVLIRKPVRSALTQFFLELTSIPSSGSALDVNLNTFLNESKVWDPFLVSYVEHWVVFYKDVMSVYKPEEMCLLEYEELRDDPFTALTESCFPSFLGHPIINEGCLNSRQLFDTFIQVGLKNNQEATLLRDELTFNEVSKYSQIRADTVAALRKYIEGKS